MDEDFVTRLSFDAAIRMLKQKGGTSSELARSLIDARAERDAAVRAEKTAQLVWQKSQDRVRRARMELENLTIRGNLHLREF